MLDENLRGTKMIVVDSFDHNSHIFKLIKTANIYYLKFEQNPNYIKRLIIKPDFWVFFQDGSYEHGINLLKPLNSSNNKILAMNFNIDPEIFGILISQNLISYSKAMADLYDFDPKCSRDYSYHHRDYKHTKNKFQVLQKLREGKFN